MKALVVENHPIVRDAVKSALLSTGLFTEVVVCGTFEAAQEILQQDTSFDLITLDLNLKDTRGAEGALVLRNLYPEISVVIFSDESTAEVATKVYECGVSGFILKSSPVDMLLSAIELIMSGGTYIPVNLAKKLDFDPKIAPTCLESLGKLALSPKQHAVFMQLLAGRPNKLIAEHLSMAEGTVKAHLNSVYRVLKVKNRSQAILLARDLRII